MSPSTFLKALAVGTAFWCALYLAFTGAVDPYGVSPLKVSVARINKYKPKRLDIDRLIKPYEVWYRQPRTVFLGTSRIHQSIDPAILNGTRYAPAYNASIPASSLGLNISHLRQYIRLDPKLRTVFVELFLYNFIGQGQEHPPKDLMEYVRNSIGLFVSTDSLWATMQTVYYNVHVNVPCYEIKPGGYFHYPPGHNTQGPFSGYAAGIWKYHEGRANGMKLYDPAFASVRELIQLASEHDLELIFVLTPNHAYDDYYIDAVNEWHTIEEWLKRVSAGAMVYSFSQPNSWVYEPVGPHMRYWNDPYHFSLTMGEGMQKSLAGAAPSDAPSNFMIRMTPSRVSQHVESRRRAVEEWAARNPDFVRRFDEEREKWLAERKLKAK